MAIIGTAEVEILPESKNFASKATKDIDSQVGKIGASAGKIFAGAFTAAGAGIFLKQSVAEAQEARKVAAQTAAVIKSTGGVAKVTASDVDKLSTAISNKVGIDDEAIASAENLLLTFTNLRNETGAGNDIFNQATKTLIDMGVALKTGPTGSAIQLGKALNDPTKGIVALTRVGVTFTQQQKDQIKALQASGDILGAQKIILGELNKEFGGSAEAQATAQDRLSTTWKNLQEDIGTALLPALDDLANMLSVVLPKALDIAKQAFGAIGDITKPLQHAAEGVFDSWFDPEKGALGKSNFDRGLDVLKERFNRFLLGDDTQNAALAAQTAKAFGIAPGAAAPAAGESGLLGIKIADAQHDAEVLKLADANASTFAKIIAKTENLIADAFGLDVTAHASQFSEAFATGLAVLQADISAGWARIQDDAVKFWQTWGDDIETIVGGVWDVIGGIFDIGVSQIVGSLKIISDLLHGDFGQAFDDVKSQISGLFTGIEEVVTGSVTVIRGVLGTIFQGVGAGITGVLNGIIGGFESALNFAIRIVNTALDALDKAAGPFVNFGDVSEVTIPRIGGAPSSPGAFRRVQQAASGGELLQGGVILVGENGPEVVRLPTGSQIIPIGAAQLQPMSFSSQSPFGAGLAPGSTLGGGSPIEVHNDITIPHAKGLTPLQQGDLVGRAIGLALTSAVA
jgi:acid phosphatase family membrane protein YuiD